MQNEGDRMKLDDAVDWLKRVWLSRIVGYRNPQYYWDKRWWVNLKSTRTDYTDVTKAVKKIMARHECKSVLEIGCGRYPLSSLPGYIALDFSRVALGQSGLKEYIFADITHRIPLPDQSVDAIYSGNVLLHIPPDKILTVTKEYRRIARKCIILAEPEKRYKSAFNCYWHDLEEMFKDYSGKIVFIGGRA